MTNNDMFEQMFGYRLPYLKMCTRQKCPKPCPFSYECKTWLESEFELTPQTKKAISDEVMEKFYKELIQND